MFHSHWNDKLSHFVVDRETNLTLVLGEQKVKNLHQLQVWKAKVSKNMKMTLLKSSIKNYSDHMNIYIQLLYLLTSTVLRTCIISSILKGNNRCFYQSIFGILTFYVFVLLTQLPSQKFVPDAKFGLFLQCQDQGELFFYHPHSKFELLSLFSPL